MFKRIICRNFLTYREAYKAKELITDKIMSDPNIMSIGIIKDSKNMFVIEVAALNPPKETLYEGVPSHLNMTIIDNVKKFQLFQVLLLPVTIADLLRSF